MLCGETTNDVRGGLPFGQRGLRTGSDGMKWQPIETAPKDGTPVLIWTPEGHDIASYSPREDDGQQSMGHDAGWWGCLTPADPGRHMGNPDYYREAECQPTHWMPLPEPPDHPEGDQG